MKTIGRIATVVLIFFLFSCSNNVNQNLENHNEDNNVTIETNDIKDGEIESKEENVESQTNEENLSDLINSPYKAKSVATINVRIKPSIEAKVRGYVRPNDCFEVFETMKDDQYIWCRIGTNAWVANDGKWIERIPYNSIIECDYPDLINPKTHPKEIEISYVSGQSIGPDDEPSKGKSMTTFLYDEAGKFIGYVSQDEKYKHAFNHMSSGPVYGFYIGSDVINTEENGLVISQMIDNRYENEIEYDSDGRIIKITSPYNSTDECISYRYDENGRLIEYIGTFGNLDFLLGNEKYDNDGRIIESIDSIEYNGNIILINNDYSGNHMAGENAHALIRISSGRIEETSWAQYSYDTEKVYPEFSNSIYSY